MTDKQKNDWVIEDDDDVVDPADPLEDVDFDQPLDATGTPLESPEAQTQDSPESLETPASSEVQNNAEDTEVDESTRVTDPNAVPQPIRREITEDGYVVDVYREEGDDEGEEGTLGTPAESDNDLQAVVAPEPQDLNK